MIENNHGREEQDMDKMKISIKVKTNSKKESVEKIGRNKYIVCVNKPARENLANIRSIELLSDYLNIPKSKILLVSGAKSKIKILELV